MMKIPTTLKHKPVIVAEDYEKIDGRYAYDSDAKGLTLGSHNGMTAAAWKFPQKCGAIRAKNGPANRRNCPCTAFWTLPFWNAKHSRTSERRTAKKICMTKITRRLRASACRAMP